jgi:hypothetical protein
LQKYSKDDYKYLDKDGPLVCSSRCVFDWLLETKAEVNPLSLGDTDRYCGIVDVGHPAEVYSNRLRMWFRSHFEENVAEVLDDMDFKWKYESVGFTWKTKIYTPDFYFPESHLFIEVKGKWQASQRSKYNDFREVWPEVKLLVVPWLLADEFRDIKEML